MRTIKLEYKNGLVVDVYLESKKSSKKELKEITKNYFLLGLINLINFDLEKNNINVNIKQIKSGIIFTAKSSNCDVIEKLENILKSNTTICMNNLTWRLVEI